MTRHPDNCEYREELANKLDDRCRCRLLRGIFHEIPDVECIVKRDTCEACCASFPPNRHHPNPPVASAVFQIASGLVNRKEGNPEIQAAAIAIRQFAVAHLQFEKDYLHYDDALTAAEDSPSQVDLESIIPAPRCRTGPNVRNWAVGITTARRREPTLSQCIRSLINAGWTSFHVFEDGVSGQDVTPADGRLTTRLPPVGAWPNFYLALVELLMREPDADAVFMLQDDVILANHRGLRQFVERALWPGRRPGIVSLFCPAQYTSSTNGWSCKEGAWFWGAQAFVFERDIARRFISSDFVIRHRWSCRTRGLANIDWLVGEWAARAGVPVSFPTPSLVQHIGRTSAIWSASNLEGDRLASRYLGAELPPSATNAGDCPQNTESERPP